MEYSDKLKIEILIVLDSLKYKSKEYLLKNSLYTWCKPMFYYTSYENWLVVFFQRMPFIGNFFSHITYWSISFYTSLKLFFGNRLFYKIFINPIVAIFYCLFARLFKRNEHIIIAGFLFEQKDNKLYFGMRKWFVNFCYKNVSAIIVYSKHEVQHYSNLFPRLASKFIFIKYGRDYDFFEVKESKSAEPYIASGGVSNRDFNTLLNAFALLEPDFPELKCKIATRPMVLELRPGLKNIEIIYDIKLETFGNFLNESLFVIIPLANTPLSAGHMVLLEAMYKEKIILITNISSVQDYVNKELVYFYQPGNADNLAEQIKYLYLNKDKPEVLQKAKDAKDFYLSNYTFPELLKRIVKTMDF